MNKYELTLILDSKATSAKKKKVTEAIEKGMKIFKGEIKNSKEWGVRELAYNLGKNGSGFYFSLELELDAKGVKTLSNQLKNNPDILRYLVIRKEK